MVRLIEKQPDTTVSRFAKNVARLRKSLFGTVEAACAISGISIPRWYRAEQGTHPSMLGDIIDRMAEVLKTTPEELVRDPTIKKENGHGKRARKPKPKEESCVDSDAGTKRRDRGRRSNGHGNTGVG